LFISENRGAISGNIPKCEGSSTEILEPHFIETDYAELKNKKGALLSGFEQSPSIRTHFGTILARIQPENIPIYFLHIASIG